MSEKTNREVVTAFVRGEYPNSGYGNVHSTASGALFSYHAKIAEWSGGDIVVYDGWDGYSRTTSKHFRQLHYALDKSGIDWEAVHEPDKGNSVKDRWR